MGNFGYTLNSRGSLASTQGARKHMSSLDRWRGDVVGKELTSDSVWVLIGEGAKLAIIVKACPPSNRSAWLVVGPD